MKKILFTVMAVIGCFTMANAEEISINDIKEMKEYHIARSVVFRSTQKLVASDGRKIYLYRNGTCEMRNGDRVEVTCRYRLQDGEVRFLDENGNTIYAGSYVLRRDRMNISTLTLAGTRYVNRN